MKPHEIRARRAERRLSQAALAALAGVSVDSVRRLESEEHMARHDVLPTIRSAVERALGPAGVGGVE